MALFTSGGGRRRRLAFATTVGILLATGPLAVPPTAAVHIGRQQTTATVGPINPVAPALSFGVMTEGDANLGRDENQGTLAVGGDLTFDNYRIAGNTVGSFVAPGDSVPSALVVGGRVNFAGSVAGSRLQVLSGGYAKIGDLSGTFVRNTDNNGASVNTRILPVNDYEATPRVELTTQQPVSSVGPTSPINFTAAFESFRGTATALATCDNTVILRTPNGDPLPQPIPPGSNAVVSLTPGVTNVLNISATDLNNIEILTFASQPTASTPLLINVDTSGVGDSFAWTAPNFAGIGGTEAQYILLNFPTATQLTLTPQARTIEGSIYAPNADLVDLSSANVEGSIITRTFDHQGGAITYFPFSTTLACEGATTASIALVKSSTTTLIGSVGQQVPYSFDVVNTGGVTLTGVTVTDEQTPPSSNANLGPITCPVTTLAPGESTRCTATYTVTQADLDNGAVSDTATASGTPVGSTTPVASEPDTLTIPAAQLTPALSVLKSSTTATIATVGQQVPYQFLVSNTGELTLTGIAVTDVQQPPSSNANLGPITCPVTTLAPGEATTCTATYTVTQADLDNDGVTNTATAQGTPPGTTTPITSAPSTLTIPADEVVPVLAIVKSSTVVAIHTVGQRVPYTFRVVNTGGQVLTGINIADTQIPPSSNADLGPITCTAVTLAPGESTTCTATYTVTQADLDNGAVSNSATARGTPVGGGPPVVSDPSTLTIRQAGVRASISVVKSSTTTVITRIGQRVPLSYLVVNTGGVTLSGVTVTDTLLPPAHRANLSSIRCGPDGTPSGSVTLTPGESIQCRSTYVVSAADFAQASLLDVATATGRPPAGRAVVSPPAPHDIPIGNASLTLAKSASPSQVDRAGEHITYRFLVTNTGRFTLTGVTVVDNPVAPADPANLGPITCGPDGAANGSVILAAGASITCVATYRISSADARHGSVTDTARATGTPPSGPAVVSPEVTLTIPVGGLPITGGAHTIPLVAFALLAVLCGLALVFAADRGGRVPGRAADQLR